MPSRFWTPPPTFVAGDKFRVGEFNTYARDNLEVLHDRPGALAQFSALTDRPPELIVSAGGWFAVPLNNERRDSGGLHSNDASNTRLTVPPGSPGLWFLAGHAQILYQAAGPGGGLSRNVALRVNGKYFVGADSVFRTLTTHENQSVSVLVPLSPGDYVELVVYHDSANDLTAVRNSQGASPELRAQFLAEVRPYATAPAWQGLHTWVNHEVLDAADLNAQLRDNPSFLRYRPMAALTDTAGQSVASGSWQQLNVGTLLGQNGVWNGTANQLTVPTGLGGLYLVSAAYGLVGSATGSVRRIGVLHSSGNRILVKSFNGWGAEAGWPTFATARLVRLAAGDTLKLQAFHDIGSSWPTMVGSYPTSLAACWMAP